MANCPAPGHQAQSSTERVTVAGSARLSPNAAQPRPTTPPQDGPELAATAKLLHRLIPPHSTLVHPARVQAPGNHFAQDSSILLSPRHLLKPTLLGSNPPVDLHGTYQTGTSEANIILKSSATFMLGMQGCLISRAAAIPRCIFGVPGLERRVQPHSSNVSLAIRHHQDRKSVVPAIAIWTPNNF